MLSVAYFMALIKVACTFLDYHNGGTEMQLRLPEPTYSNIMLLIAVLCLQFAMRKSAITSSYI